MTELQKLVLNLNYAHKRLVSKKADVAELLAQVAQLEKQVAIARAVEKKAIEDKNRKRVENWKSVRKEKKQRYIALHKEIKSMLQVGKTHKFIAQKLNLNLTTLQKYCAFHKLKKIPLKSLMRA
jgi:DNA-binding NarL/FixJ family response regulator